MRHPRKTRQKQSPDSARKLVTLRKRVARDKRLHRKVKGESE